MRFQDQFMFFLSTALFGYTITRSALKEILQLSIGRKHKYREVIKQQTVIKRITMSYIPGYVKHRQGLFKVLLTVNYIYLVLISLFIVLCFLSIFQINVIPVIRTITTIKGLVLDLPLCLFFLIKTGHDKVHGGREWKI